MSDTHDLVVPESQEPIPDPGLPEHEPRLTDAYPEAARRVERQVAALFVASMVCALGFCVAYFTLSIGDHVTTVFGLGASNVVLGIALGLCLLSLGGGAIHWARKLMTDHEIVEYRHPASSSQEDRTESIAAFTTGVEESGIGRRPLIRNTLIGALGMLGLPAIVALRDLGPLPGDMLYHTVWRKNMRVVQDVDGAYIKPSDLVVGQLVNCEPNLFFETNADGQPKVEGTELLQEKAKAATILVRMDPNDITPLKGRENWGIEGILCYSKICTHVGCPISLWEHQTHHLLCPCHQSTFDLADNGKVVFGPAARPLPQLPIMTDSAGYIVAQSDFHEPVGPSFWERG